MQLLEFQSCHEVLKTEEAARRHSLVYSKLHYQEHHETPFLREGMSLTVSGSGNDYIDPRGSTAS